jgi:hypothetical protein
MESSTRTGQLEPAGGQPEPASFHPTSERVSADVATPEVQPSMIASIRQQCSACGATMASDQRYCVECGQRRGAPRVPLRDGVAPRSKESPSARRSPRRVPVPINSTVIAGIGTLLLAMGVGVLIGRSGNTNAKTPAPQVVTVAGSGTTAPTATASAAPPAPTAEAAKATKAAAAAGAKSAAKTHAAPPKAVKVGSTGTGPGYQHGHFTGNFFGPESK